MKRNLWGLRALVLSVAISTSVSAQVDPVAEANRRKAEAEAAIAESNASTAASNAEKASSEAATAAAKARFGTMADYSTAGTTEAGTGAGKTESQLLSSDATQALARSMIDQLKLVRLDKANILIASEAGVPTFEAYDAFLAQLEQHERELRQAQRIAPKGEPPDGLEMFMGGPGLGTTINVIGNLLRSDYKVAGVDWTPDELLLSRAILVQAKRRTFNKKFFTPAVNPPTMAKGNLAIDALGGLVAEQGRAEARLKAVQASSLSNKKLDYSEAIAALEAAIKRSEAFQAMLRTAKDGVTPLVVVGRQAHFAKILRDGYVLSIKAHAAGGSTYTRKNFWTFFGTMPFYVSGGALGSYVLTDGATGEVLDTGVFGRMQPYMKAHDVATRAGLGAADPD